MADKDPKLEKRHDDDEFSKDPEVGKWHPEVEEPRQKTKQRAGEVSWEAPEISKKDPNKVVTLFEAPEFKANKAELARLNERILEEKDEKTLKKLKRARNKLESSVAGVTTKAHKIMLNNYQTLSDSETLDQRTKLKAQRRENLLDGAKKVNNWALDATKTVGAGLVVTAETIGKILVGAAGVTKDVGVALGSMVIDIAREKKDKLDSTRNQQI